MNSELHAAFLVKALGIAVLLAEGAPPNKNEILNSCPCSHNDK